MLVSQPSYLCVYWHSGRLGPTSVSQHLIDLNLPNKEEDRAASLLHIAGSDQLEKRGKWGACTERTCLLEAPLPGGRKSLITVGIHYSPASISSLPVPTAFGQIKAPFQANISLLLSWKLANQHRLTQELKWRWGRPPQERRCQSFKDIYTFSGPVMKNGFGSWEFWGYLKRWNGFTVTLKQIDKMLQKSLKRTSYHITRD